MLPTVSAQKARSARYYLEALTADLVTPRIDPSGPPGEWFYFMHIEKTAGTSLIYSLYRAFPQAQVFPNLHQERKYFYDRFPLWDEVDANASTFLPRELKMLVGHFGMGPIDRFSVRPRVFTFLRDPIERLISGIQFNRQPGRRYFGLSFDEILAKHAWREGSMQAQAFGYDHDLDNIDEVLENLLEVDFVGFLDSYDSCISRLSTFLGLPKKLHIEHRNRSSGFELNDSQRERVEYLTTPDRRLYELARERHPMPSVG